MIFGLVFLTLKYRQDIRELSDQISTLQTENGLNDKVIRPLNGEMDKLGIRNGGELDANFALEFDGKSHLKTPVRFDGSHSLTVEAGGKPGVVDGPYRTVVGDKEASGFALIKHDRGAFWRFQIHNSQT